MIFLTLKDAKVHVIILPCTVIKKNLKLSAGTVLYMSALPVIIKNVSYKIWTKSSTYNLSMCLIFPALTKFMKNNSPTLTTIEKEFLLDKTYNLVSQNITWL